MQAFTQLTAIVAPLDRPNVDTDAIIPKQFLKTIQRTGLGVNLFDEWRYLDRGEPGRDVAQRPRNPDFVLNQPRYRDTQILLARENFGCGSSREHAPWALLDYGIRAIVAPSYADIFYNNCFKNGILPVRLDAALVDRLFQNVAAQPGYQLSIDLATETISTPDGQTFGFTVEPHARHNLLHGLDDIGLTLQHRAAIQNYEVRRRREAPWLFAS